ncbi:MAG TPA: hypothetical protein VKR31_17855 [Rhizomicrobium sp.]|nr:hypothetical protein [Rhizomicrobium sp.]
MSDDAVEIRFRADLSDLEAGTSEAADLLGKAADQMARAFEQESLKEVAIATDRNDALYRLGAESLEQWRAQAIAEADDRYAAELSYIDRKEAADRGDAAAEARDEEQRRIVYENHVLALQKIDERYAQEKQTEDRQALADAISADNARLASGLRTIDTEFRTHQIGADERYRLEQELTEEIYGEELKRLDALIATLAAGTKAYEQAIREREKIEQEFARQSQTNSDRLETEEAQKWTELGNSIKSSFNSALDGLVFGGKTFGQFMLQVAEGVAKAFLQMGENIAENWIEQQLAGMFETKATQGATALAQISDAAGVAGANAFAATAAIPVVGPELAPAAGAAAASEALSFSSFLSLATGAWELKSDALAQLHKGEMVVPENFASGLRAMAGPSGLDAGRAGDVDRPAAGVHMNYAPTINAREPASLKQMLVTESSEMLAWLSRQFRNGALRV